MNLYKLMNRNISFPKPATLKKISTYPYEKELLLAQPIRHLVLQASFYDGHYATGCTFEVSLNEGPFIEVPRINSEQVCFKLPSERGLHRLRIKVIPSTAEFWPLTGEFTFDKNEKFVVINAPAEFLAPHFIVEAEQGLAIRVITILAQLRDATEDVLNSLALIPQSRRNAFGVSTFPLTRWETQRLNNRHYVAMPPINNRKLEFDRLNIYPNTDQVVLEVAGVSAPRLIAVTWPSSVSRSRGAIPTPFLIYFHPTATQNVRRGFYIGPGLGSYPFGWDYLFYGFWSYLTYFGDPLTEYPYTKGLPYQIQASGKSMVLVLPGNKVGEDVGVLFDPARMEGILREIQGFMFRRAGNSASPPPLGRTALASFSDGNELAIRFLRRARNQGHPFYQNILKELYMFDGPGNRIADWISEAIQWSRVGVRQEKRIRAYTRNNFASYRTLLGQNTPPNLPFVASPGIFSGTNNGPITASALPIPAWQRATTGYGASPSFVNNSDWQICHQLISALMLTDALRRSEF